MSSSIEHLWMSASEYGRLFDNGNKSLQAIGFKIKTKKTILQNNY